MLRSGTNENISNNTNIFEQGDGIKITDMKKNQRNSQKWYQQKGIRKADYCWWDLSRLQESNSNIHREGKCTRQGIVQM